MDYRINEIREELENLYEKNGLTEEVLILSMKLDKEINKVQKKILKDNDIYIKK
ncbi:Spo0E family sporulation regulatory protein-aspartic acid phosphatase [Clostridium sp. Sa3CUN1]|uniref:Spo0E family sporulation regulatory protein-aspartic acid phosphatase n=1 Tax=Clostridium gallinarum TaxID=2762246 RepID=A0ABR8Q869_9CLOT|nr:Spo0E family sporulation regulatory protein-aspartic acid phosphatase [Clostridium gallinarum]MBD7916621.1 Spo0E family sporulation regulatory protein-aspartic acid phosphatase [Clostridium gallinarum]